MTNSEAPIACSLTGGAFAERLEWLRELKKRALVAQWREGGALHLIVDKSARREVEELIEKENACCGFLNFATADVERGIRVTITPPRGMEEFIDQLLSHFEPETVS